MAAEDDLLVARICAMVLLPGITFILGMLPTWLAQIFKVHFYFHI